MKQLSIMLKPASSLCNLRCKYCFYANVADLREVHSYGMMRQETTEAILSNIRNGLKKGDQITFSFQGGEPTLAGLDYFKHFLSITDTWKDVHISYALQTNAILLDDEWCQFLKKHNFLVGVSWDILPECHDSVRIDPESRGTNRKVLAAINLLKAHGVEFNILCTLTNYVARHPNQVWKQLLKQDIQFVQFTPCLDELDAPGTSDYALTPERFAAFYDRLFPLWFADYQAGKYRSVKLFDDIVNLLAFGSPTACGINGHCHPQVIVEADGSTYPCDFYCIDQYKLGNLATDDLLDLLKSPRVAAFANRPHRQPELCNTCEFIRFCGGNCKRMQAQICCKPEETFCGYQNLLRSHAADFNRIAAHQRQLRRMY